MTQEERKNSLGRGHRHEQVERATSGYMALGDGTRHHKRKHKFRPETRRVGRGGEIQAGSFGQDGALLSAARETSSAAGASRHELCIVPLAHPTVGRLVGMAVKDGFVHHLLSNCLPLLKGFGLLLVKVLPR